LSKKNGKTDSPPPGRFRPFADLEIPRDEPAHPAPDAPPPGPAPSEDVEFASAMDGVVKLEGTGSEPRDREPRPPRLPDEEDEWKRFADDFLSGGAGFDIQWSDEYVEGRRRDVDRSTMERLRTGRYAWQDYIDLHGMTRDEARVAVERFMVDQRKRNHRCVLVVHGRGKGSAGGLPVLKEKLVAWLTREGGIGTHVIAFTSARPCDGGVGAIYVLLRHGG